MNSLKYIFETVHHKEQQTQIYIVFNIDNIYHNQLFLGALCEIREDNFMHV